MSRAGSGELTEASLTIESLEFYAEVLFPRQDIHILGIGQRNTISNGPDDGTLNKSAACFWNPLRHGTTTKAVDNLLGHTNERIANIDGHGNRGLLETGAGQNGDWTDDNIVAGWNQWGWEVQFARLKDRGYSLMALWGCHTGEGQEGADLLFSIAQIAGFPVQATNGFVYTNGQSVWIEPNAVWVTATPTVRPTPVQAPTPHNILVSELDCAYIVIDGHLLCLPFASIAEVRITVRKVMDEVREHRLAGTDAGALGWRIFGTRPLKLPGRPSAMVTAEVSVLFKRGEQPIRVELTIYNDKLAFDQISGYACYLRGRISELF